MKTRTLCLILLCAACGKKGDKAGPGAMAAVLKPATPAPPKDAPQNVSVREKQAGARGSSVKETLIKQALMAAPAGGSPAAALGENVAAAPTAAPAQPAPTKKGDFKLVVEPGTDSELRTAVVNMLTKLLDGLNRTLKMPRDIPVILGKCHTINAFYSPQEQNIRVCDEIVDFFAGVFAQYKPAADVQKTVLSALLFIFLHETGHCLIDQFQIPSTGREEDAVDQLATVLLIASGEHGADIAMTGGESFLAMNVFSEGGPNHTPYWDEHAFDEQRFYNIVCLVFGSNPDKFGDFVKEGDLPMERAVRCPAEFKKIYGAWDRLITPYTMAAQK